jgi:hypothetical protein
MRATTVPATGSSTTTIQGGVFHTATRRNAARELHLKHDSPFYKSSRNSAAKIPCGVGTGKARIHG